jgi:hypothetical protein
MPRMVNLNAYPNPSDKLGDTPKVIVIAKGMMGVTTMLLPLSLGALQRGIEAWDNGAYVQDAFPTLNADQREFLMTGITPGEFDKMFEEGA